MWVPTARYHSILISFVFVPTSLVGKTQVEPKAWEGEVTGHTVPWGTDFTSSWIKFCHLVWSPSGKESSQGGLRLTTRDPQKTGKQICSKSPNKKEQPLPLPLLCPTPDTVLSLQSPTWAKQAGRSTPGQGMGMFTALGQVPGAQRL